MGKPNFSNKSRFRFGGDAVYWGGYFQDEYIVLEKLTRRTETSKYPEEKKSTEISLVAASERGPALKLNLC